MRSSGSILAGAALAVAAFMGPRVAAAATVNQQCGQQYQAAKAANTLNGMTWNQFRSDCAAKLKAEPAAATTAAPPATAANPLIPAPAPQATPPAPAPATAAPAPAAPATGGRAAFVTRERECGSEWRASKASLVAQTPGLTWPKYLSQCNARLKASGK